MRQVTTGDAGAGFVYLIQCGETDLYKIGASENGVEERLASCQTGCPYKLHIIEKYVVKDYHKVEKKLHQDYDFCRYRRPGEWYKLDSEQVFEIKVKLLVDAGRDGELYAMLDIIDSRRKSILRYVTRDAIETTFGKLKR